MGNRIGLRFWIAVLLITVIYSLLFLVVPASFDINHIADVATLTTFFGALAFIAIYTLFGFTGRARWWRMDVGTVIVALAFSYLPQTGVLAWALLFHHGVINEPFQAWMYVGGLAMSALTMLCACAVWLRNESQHRNGGQDGGQDDGTDD